MKKYWPKEKGCSRQGLRKTHENLGFFYLMYCRFCSIHNQSIGSLDCRARLAVTVTRTVISLQWRRFVDPRGEYYVFNWTAITYRRKEGINGTLLHDGALLLLHGTVMY